MINSAHSLYNQILLSLPKNSARGRFVRSVKNYSTLPFRSGFNRQLFWTEHQSDDGTLDRLDAFAELQTSAWSGLEDFGYKIVRKFRPQVIVELGTHMGLSALAFGLGLKANGSGHLYAVDTWQGEAHAGFYDDTVYQTFLKRCEQLDLGSIIVPFRMTFDEASSQVPTPIDLLHIDGFHSREAVEHDWAMFGPLVRPGGLVLFHDVYTQFAGIAEFWATLTPHYDHYRIKYSNGLGVLQVPMTGHPKMP